jgi:hypothetical protein
LIIQSKFPARLALRPCTRDLAALGLRLRDAADADRPFLQALFASLRAEEMALLGWPQADLDACWPISSGSSIITS